MRKDVPEILKTDAPQYHIGDNTRHHKYPCKCCGDSVWLTGDYCSFCRSQFAVANGHGISQADAIPKIREYFANGGKRQKGGRGAKTRVQTLIDWKGEWEGMASPPKITDKKNLTVQEKPQSENIPEERRTPVKKLRAIYIPLATERDQKILDFIDELAMDHRQSRNQKILSILEDAMINFCQGDLQKRSHDA
jgi:hypothetical protein